MNETLFRLKNHLAKARDLRKAGAVLAWDQETFMPPGGAAVVDFKVEVPGSYVLVDHALSRAERGLAGILEVEGDANPDVFSASAKEARATHGH